VTSLQGRAFPRSLS